MLTGLLIAWVGAVPILTYLQPDAESFVSHTMTIWRTQGPIHRRRHDRGVGDLDTGQAVRPCRRRTGRYAARIQRVCVDGPLDRDMSPGWIVWLTVACLAVSGWLAYSFASSTALAPYALRLTLIAVPFVFIVGFLIAGVAGYMAGHRRIEQPDFRYRHSRHSDVRDSSRLRSRPRLKRARCWSPSPCLSRRSCLPAPPSRMTTCRI